MSKQIINQIPVSNCSREQYRHLIALLEKDGYKAAVNLQDERKDIHGIVIDNLDKTVSIAGITYLAAWCGFRRYPLNYEQFIKNYEKLLIEPDHELYKQLTEENEAGKQCGIIIK